MLFFPDSEVKVCGNCVHFVQHYVKIDGQYTPIHVGHCMYPRIKDRKETDTCRYWATIPEGEEQ